MSKQEGTTGWTYTGRFGRWALNSRVWIGADNPAGPMLERWRLIQTPLFGIYVHFIHREDLDRVVHDHPWTFWSLVLRGGYVEDHRPDVREVNLSKETRVHWRGQLRHFGLREAHRIISVEPGTTTLVVVGRKQRSWGFYDADGRWVDWHDADLYGLRDNEGPAGSRPAGTPQMRSAQQLGVRADIRDDRVVVVCVGCGTPECAELKVMCPDRRVTGAVPHSTTIIAKDRP